MSIRTRTTKNGQRRYDVRLRDVAGKEYWRSFRTRKEAERFEATERADRARGSWIDPRRGDTRFREVATEWLDSHPGKKETTLGRDESVLRARILPILGDLPIGAITPVEVQRVVTGWSRQLAPRTVLRNFAVLRAIFNYAVDTDRIGRSPCRKIKLPEAAPVQHRIASPDELRRLAEALGPDDGPMVYVAAVLGLRWGECAGLRVKDVDFLTGVVNVENQVTRGRGGRTVTGGPKWNSHRKMAAPADLLDLLAELLRRRGLTGADRDALMFVGPRGAPLRYVNWRRRVWVPACASVGMLDLKFQALRTANATAMVALAVDVKTAQTRAGHRNAKTTLDIYARPTAAADKDAAAKLGAWFLGAQDDVNGEIARDGREIESGTRPSSDQEMGADQGVRGGAGKNRTCDLSIISAAL